MVIFKVYEIMKGIDKNGQYFIIGKSKTRGSWIYVEKESMGQVFYTEDGGGGTQR